MAQKGVYRRKVNQNTVVFVVVALIFLGLGFLKSVAIIDRRDTGEFCGTSKSEGSGSWSVEECQRVYAKSNLEVHLFNDGEVSFSYTIGFLALAGGFVYRNHALARDREDLKDKK